MRMLSVVVLWAVFLGAIGLGTPSAHADNRKFGYVYEVTTMPAGMWEYEQWVTWKTSKGNDSDFDRFDFRHEIEVGITDRLQLAVYLADWRYQDGGSVGNDRVEYKGTAFEVIYNLSDPVADPIGSALYGEVKIGDQVFELEGKILLQKDIGAWTFAYNLVLEAEWEGSDYEEDKGVIEQVFGASYQINPNWSVGGELLHEVEFDDWEHTGPSVVYLGPVVAYRAKTWWMTLTQLFQVTDIDSEADFQTRVLFGIDL